MSIVITAVDPVPINTLRPWIFLAGSIERDRAVRWQDRVISTLADHRVTLLDPHRSAWDASWRQELDDPRFTEQVEWELGNLEQADLIVWYVAPGTFASISLLELGLHARSGKMLVCCPSGFQRRGNVAAVCRRHGIPMHDSLDGLLTDLVQRITPHP